MKNLIIDFTKDFHSTGYGNIVYIIGYILSNINNSNIPIYIKIDKLYKKTYTDIFCAINYLKFGNFKILLLEPTENQKLTNTNIINIDNLKYLNDNSKNTYIINKNLKDVKHFFYYDKIIRCFQNLNIDFKKEKENILKQYITSKFKDIEKSIIINVRRR